MSCRWLPFRGSTPSSLRLADLLGVSMGLRVSWYRCPVTPLGFLPCASAAPPSAASPSGFLTPVCWSTTGVGLEGSLLRHLAFSHVPCSSSGPAGSLGVFRSPGVCPSTSLVTWVGLQPFPSFSGLLLLRLLAGVVGVLHPVSGCSSCGDVCLVCR